MDVTIRGPTRGKEGLYGKYTSLYSPVSFLNVIRSTYPVISNGVVREFRVVEGEFRDPIRYKIARVLAQNHLNFRLRFPTPKSTSKISSPFSQATIQSEVFILNQLPGTEIVWRRPSMVTSTWPC